MNQNSQFLELPPLSTLKGTKLFLLTYSHSCSLLANLDLNDSISANNNTNKPKCYYTLLFKLTLSVNLILVSDKSCFIIRLTSVNLSISLANNKFYLKTYIPFSIDQNPPSSYASTHNFPSDKILIPPLHFSKLHSIQKNPTTI